MGGALNDQNVISVPNSIKPKFEFTYDQWSQFNKFAKTVRTEPVFDPQTRDAINYVLDKNSEMILRTNNLKDDLSTLDRDY